MTRTRHKLAVIGAALALGALPGCRGFHPAPQPSRGHLILELAPTQSRATGSVLYLEPVSATTPPARGGRRADVASAGASFRPPLTVVQSGDEVRFVNGGRVAHRIFMADTQGRYERFVGPEGRSAALRISRTGEHRFYCSLHPDESFVVFAAPSLHFVVPNGVRTHRLDGIRTGSYRLSWWSEAGVRPLGLVEIRPGETATRSLAVGPAPDRKPGEQAH